MSFSTLLMPIGLYTPFVQGIGNFDFLVLIPAGVGAAVTIVVFARLISALFKKHYSVAQSIVIGTVIAATAFIIPFESFGASSGSAIVNYVCILAGVGVALLFSRFNKKYEENKILPQ
jgi:putative membrane protein